MKYYIIQQIQINQSMFLTRNRQFLPFCQHKQEHFVQLNLDAQFYYLLNIPVEIKSMSI